LGSLSTINVDVTFQIPKGFSSFSAGQEKQLSAVLNDEDKKMLNKFRAAYTFSALDTKHLIRDEQIEDNIIDANLLLLSKRFQKIHAFSVQLRHSNLESVYKKNLDLRKFELLFAPTNQMCWERSVKSSELAISTAMLTSQSKCSQEVRSNGKMPKRRSGVENSK
jgi:hypothetical protein